jgi:hypothetical protein
VVAASFHCKPDGSDDDEARKTDGYAKRSVRARDGILLLFQASKPTILSPSC